MSKDKIILTIANGSWNAEFTGPHAAMIQETFGVTTIPTAFTDKANASDVVSFIRNRNPNAVIVIGMR